MPKLIGYARVSTRQQGADRQEADLRAAGVSAELLFVDRAEGAHASLPALDAALQALEGGDTLVVPALDRLGRSTGDLLTLAAELRAEGVGLRVLDLDGADVDTSTPSGSMVFTVLSALAQTESALKRERVLDALGKRRASVADPRGGRSRKASDGRARTSGQELPEVAGGTHPPALHGLTMPIKRL
ncbi:DNA invertase Pin-like site-specific DNA recombinase [Pseudoclavibacter sp. JAI123]|uniref:recombinase family protein n=1 Tax=Pseudoclavibacter sp. JAI123 TaxID=2723065 RepID=UPI0015CDCEC9|nr:recombinase family protein [Pseudoclavibacter sp. JAI123]NYF14977.1 DNA invertase Pin-like site-specific DNA recombinase [Pseudoclavibacter sp. JAI123]